MILTGKKKNDYDGTDDTLRTDSESSRKERDLSNRPDSYQTMGMTEEAIEHPSGLTKVPGRIIERKMVRVFSFHTFFTEECFEMLHYAELGPKPKWSYFPFEGHPQIIVKFEGTKPKATPEFLQTIAYEIYVKNVTFGLLHQWLTDMGMTISKNTLQNWLKKSKKYLDELVCVLKSITLEIDNKLAEQAIRKLTTLRNNSLHYNSDDSAEMVATYHSVIGAGKPHSYSVLNFTGTFFKNIFNE